MSDQELLELAAKTEGREPPVDANGVWSAWVGSMENGHWWNPLEDDGDAIRLAVKLGMDIEITDSNVYAGCRGSFSQPATPDPCAALRRAIVMAAAEIGRSMP